MTRIVGPSKELVTWIVLVLGCVLVAMVIAITVLSVRGAIAADKRAADAERARVVTSDKATTRINGLLADNNRLADERARLVAQIARTGATPDTLPPRTTSTTAAP